MYQEEKNLFENISVDDLSFIFRQMVPSILLEIFRDANPEALTADIPALMETLSKVADDGGENRDEIFGKVYIQSVLHGEALDTPSIVYKIGTLLSIIS